MSNAPWKIFHQDGSEIIIDVDGGITIGGHTASPFPTDITHAAMCDAGLVATWVDHELRLARMALLPLTEKLEDGITKAVHFHEKEQNIRVIKNHNIFEYHHQCIIKKNLK